MSDSRIVILPLAAALGALSTGLPATTAQATTAPQAAEAPQSETAGQALAPNTLVSTGKDLLSFTVNEQADGTIVAWHSSHASHGSHVSHVSHHSSRY